MNENENNKNRDYPIIDKRIKRTYIAESNAQKTKLYDPYVRFLRWASDRVDENGIIAFVSNNSFLNARSYDGFRKVVAKEFNRIYIIDLKGDARTSGEQRRREGGNVFSDQIRVGIAVYFMVREKGVKGCRIFYNAVNDYATAIEKQAYLRDNRFRDLRFQPIHPDKNGNWLDLADDQWDELIPIAIKSTKTRSNNKSIFGLVSPGIVTARDEWVTDFSTENLKSKMKYFSQFYNEYNRIGIFDTIVKWSRNLKKRHDSGLKESFSETKITKYAYRPFTNYFVYFSEVFLDETGWTSEVIRGDNCMIAFTNPASPKPFHTIVSEYPVDFHFTGDTQYVPLYRYRETGERLENVTSWASEQFQQRYKLNAISKTDIFKYVYAVLHHPGYRNKYENNLKREFPRIPFYDDFWKWEEWGRRLMDLHLNYETVEPYKLEREDKPKDIAIIRLMARKESGVIEVDSATTLSGVPVEAWGYRLGTYSALEWILERYKERKPKDPTIAEKFNTYRFADYKEQVIDLLCRVCTVSVETMRIVREMPE